MAMNFPPSLAQRHHFGFQCGFDATYLPIAVVAFASIRAVQNKYRLFTLSNDVDTCGSMVIG
jgi:hypothetical protein